MKKTVLKKMPDIFQKAIAQLFEIRKILANSYIFAFFQPLLSPQTNVNLFQINQTLLAKYTNELSKLLQADEKNWANIIHSNSLVEFYRKTFLENIYDTEMEVPEEPNRLTKERNTTATKSTSQNSLQTFPANYTDPLLIPYYSNNAATFAARVPDYDEEYEEEIIHSGNNTETFVADNTDSFPEYYSEEYEEAIMNSVLEHSLQEF